MKPRGLALVLVSVLVGCASPSGTGYSSTYTVTGSGELSEAAAEAALAAAVASASGPAVGRPYDQPVRLLRTPQPVMSREDIDQRVVGQVVVRILFREDGLVEKVTVLNATQQSLAEAVSRAVQQWQIAPLTRAGMPQKLTARQTFTFKTAP